MTKPVQIMSNGHVGMQDFLQIYDGRLITNNVNQCIRL